MAKIFVLLVQCRDLQTIPTVLPLGTFRECLRDACGPLKQPYRCRHPLHHPLPILRAKTVVRSQQFIGGGGAAQRTALSEGALLPRGHRFDVCAERFPHFGRLSGFG
jgi:hypothetical protein